MPTPELPCSDCRTTHSWSPPLLATVLNRHEKCLLACIESGSNLNYGAYANCLTALMLAAKHGEVRFIEHLVNGGCNINQTDVYGRTALFFAVNHKKKKSKDVLIASGACKLVTQNRFYDSKILTCIVEHGWCNELQLAIDEGIDVNMIDTRNGKTALMTATQGKMYACMKILLESGADANMSYRQGRTAICYATTPEAAQILIRKGADINVKYVGYPPIKSASSHGRTKLLKTLLDNGGCPNYKGLWGGTSALWLAAHKGHDQCLALLIESGADLNDVNEAPSYTPVNAAADRGRLTCVKLLLQAGCLINIHPLLSVTINYGYQNEECISLMFAAGEMLSSEGESDDEIPDLLKYERDTIDLKHLARRSLRNCLLRINPNCNLFLRIPMLHLPEIITNYLLYDMSLE